MEYALIMMFLTVVVTLAFFGGSVNNYYDQPDADAASFEESPGDPSPSIVHALNERQQDFTHSIYQP